MGEHIELCKECGGKCCICVDDDGKWSAHCMDCNNTIGNRGFYDPCAPSRGKAIAMWNKLNATAERAVMLEETVSSQRVYDGRLLKVDRLVVALDADRVSVREIVVFPEVVVVLALFRNSDVLLVRQFRKAVEATMLEPVAGKVDPGETPEVAARRELKEETGYDCLSIEKIKEVYPTPGYSTEKQHYFVATIDGEPGKQQGDDDEKICVVRMDGKQVMDIIRSKEPIDGKLVMALGFSAVRNLLGFNKKEVG